ncbi:PspC domain-containing protein [Tsukamurella hominis]|uniref:PspC domain-containing protein n=1 Tax=Tsukamurella hominis TaxID=1970232 RepID=UPI0039E90890
MTENDPFAPNPYSPPAPPQKRFARDVQNNWIGGVCAGIARYFGIDATLVRVLFVVSCLLPGPQFLLYLLLWLVMPKD